MDLPNDLPYNEYYEYFGPDYTLHPTLTTTGSLFSNSGSNTDIFRTSARNIPNQNTRSYLEFLQAKVAEHLRLLQGAPSVQMYEIPPELTGVVDGSLMNDVNEELESARRDRVYESGISEEEEEEIRLMEIEERVQSNLEFFDEED